MSLSMLIFRWKHVIKFQIQNDFINYWNDILIESVSFGKLAFLIELRRFISNIYIYTRMDLIQSYIIFLGILKQMKYVV